MRLQKDLCERYERELDPVFAASRLWVDDVIDPARTRSLISLGIGLAAHNPYTPRFTTGVIQV
jgi:acetyl-CoA carboxylase carboxyltransferase component